jgi:hypothetical protein
VRALALVLVMVLALALVSLRPSQSSHEVKTSNPVWPHERVAGDICHITADSQSISPSALASSPCLELIAIL